MSRIRFCPGCGRKVDGFIVVADPIPNSFASKVDCLECGRAFKVSPIGPRTRLIRAELSRKASRPGAEA